MERPCYTGPASIVVVIVSVFRAGTGRRDYVEDFQDAFDDRFYGRDAADY